MTPNVYILYETLSDGEVVSNANSKDQLHSKKAWFVYTYKQTIQVSFIRHNQAINNIWIFVHSGNKLLTECTS